MTVLGLTVTCYPFSLVSLYINRKWKLASQNARRAARGSYANRNDICE